VSLREILEILEPPVDATAEQLLRWRILMARVSSLLVLMVIFCFSWSFGLVPWLDGFASAGEVAGYERQRIETDIFDTQRRLCQSPMGSQLRLSYANQLTKLISQWRGLTGNQTGPEVLSCMDLLGTP